MSATLTIRGLGAGHGARTLFTGLDLVVAEGDVWGLTGANGSGKSTLLSALAGDPTAEITGEITPSPPQATVGLLRQEVERRPGETVRDFLDRATGVASARRRMDSAAEDMADDADMEEYSRALEEWLALGGGDLPDRMAPVVGRLGLPESTLDLPMTALSGGQAARVNLALVLLSQHDVLLLDEPTNDLDLSGLEILEDFVAGERRPMVVVSGAWRTR